MIITDAVFRIIETFPLANRGFVLAGDIISGTIRQGDHILFRNDGHKIGVQIKGIEYIDKAIGKIACTGLIISWEDEEKLQGLNVEQTEVEIRKQING